MLGKIFVILALAFIASAQTSGSSAGTALPDSYLKCDPSLPEQCTIFYGGCSSCTCGTAINTASLSKAQEEQRTTCANYQGPVCDMMCPIQKAACSKLGVCVIKALLPTPSLADKKCSVDEECTDVPSVCGSCCGPFPDTPVNVAFAELYKPEFEEVCAATASPCGSPDVVCSPPLKRPVGCVSGYCAYKEEETPVDPVPFDRSCKVPEDCTVIASTCGGCCGPVLDTPVSVHFASTYKMMCPAIACMSLVDCAAPEPAPVTCSPTNQCVFASDKLTVPPPLPLSKAALYCRTSDDCTYVPASCGECCPVAPSIVANLEFARAYNDVYNEQCPLKECNPPPPCAYPMMAQPYCVNNQCSSEPAVDPINCFVNPCDVTKCPAHPDATCTSDANCNPVFSLGGVLLSKEACQPPVIQTIAIPPEFQTCDDASECVAVADVCDPCLCSAGYRGSVNSMYLEKYNNLVATTCQTARLANVFCNDLMCPMMMPMPYCVQGKCSMKEKVEDPCDPSMQVKCFADPCSVSSCPAHPNAQCQADYCGGCNARFFVAGKEVTDSCIQRNCFDLSCDSCLNTKGCGFCSSFAEQTESTGTTNGSQGSDTGGVTSSIPVARCMPGSYLEKCAVVGSFSEKCATPRPLPPTVTNREVLDENAFNAELTGAEDAVASKFVMVVLLVLRDSVQEDSSAHDLLQMYIDLTGDGEPTENDKAQLCTMLAKILSRLQGIDVKKISKCQIDPAPAAPATKRATSGSYVATMTVDTTQDSGAVAFSLPFVAMISLFLALF